MSRIVICAKKRWWPWMSGRRLISEMAAPAHPRASGQRRGLSSSCSDTLLCRVTGLATCPDARVWGGAGGADPEGSQLSLGTADRPDREQRHFRRKTFLFSWLRSLSPKYASRSEPTSWRRKVCSIKGSYATRSRNSQGVTVGSDP